MRALRIVLTVLTLANMLAFAQDNPPANADAASKPLKATVYVYRYKQFVGSALAPSVFCDEVQLARMENGRYFTVSVDPGSHTFRSNDAQSGMLLDTKPGQEYFIRVEIAAGVMKGHGRLVLTSPEQGRYELQSNKLKPLDEGKVADKSKVSVAEARFDTPLPTPAAVVPVTMKTQPSTKPEDADPAREVVLSDGAPDAASQMSLGDAARKARQKKTASDSATAPPQ